MAYNDDAVLARLSALNESHDSIATAAQWIMFHKYEAIAFSMTLILLTFPSHPDAMPTGLSRYGFRSSRSPRALGGST